MPLVVLIIAFGVIIILNKKGLMLGISLIVGSLIIMVLTGSLRNIIVAVIDTINNITTLDLLVSINLIQVLGIMLEEVGVLKRLVDRLLKLIKSKKLVLTLIPMITALIPGPGVVLLSAPIVGEASRDENLGGTDKSFVNFWFRAAVQASSPLTFAFVLATGIVTVNRVGFFLGLLPFTVVMILSGYWCQLRYTLSKRDTVSYDRTNWISLVRDLMFIWIVILLYLVFNLPFSIGIAAAVVWIILTERPKMVQVRDYLFRGISFETTILILGIMFFKTVIEISGLMEVVIDWFMSLGAPLLIPVIVLTLLVGLVTGNYAGAIALTFASFGDIYQSISYWVVLNIVTRIGCWFSPVNSSRLLSIDYFSGSDSQLLRKVLVSLLPVFILLNIYLFVFI